MQPLAVSKILASPKIDQANLEHRIVMVGHGHTATWAQRLMAKMDDGTRYVVRSMAPVLVAEVRCLLKDSLFRNEFSYV